MTPEAFAERLRERVLLLDGGMGSLLIDMGLTSGTAPERWNVEFPQRIVEAHRKYVEAGSQAIHTNTFGGNPIKLRHAGLADRCAEVNRKAVELARQAGAAGTLVAGDMGPTGEMFAPVGQATEEGLTAAFTQQAEALAEGGVDFFSIETMYDLREALCALKAALATGLPAMVSMTFESKKRGFFTMMGNPLADSLKQLERAGAHAVGANCSVEAPEMLDIVRQAHAQVTCAMAAQPNGGAPRPTADGVAYDVEPELFARQLAEIVQAGARVVGGCCGTNPECIRAVQALL